jgi:hypothetical protein
MYKVLRYGLTGMVEKFSIKPKSVSSEVINMVDLAMQNYYNPAISYFESLDDREKVF